MYEEFDFFVGDLGPRDGGLSEGVHDAACEPDEHPHDGFQDEVEGSEHHHGAWCDGFSVASGEYFGGDFAEDEQQEGHDPDGNGDGLEAGDTATDAAQEFFCGGGRECCAEGVGDVIADEDSGEDFSGLIEPELQGFGVPLVFVHQAIDPRST